MIITYRASYEEHGMQYQQRYARLSCGRPIRRHVHDPEVLFVQQRDDGVDMAEVLRHKLVQ